MDTDSQMFNRMFGIPVPKTGTTVTPPPPPPNFYTDTLELTQAGENVVLVNTNSTQESSSSSSSRSQPEAVNNIALNLAVLQDMIELEQTGIGVIWPPGLSLARARELVGEIG